MNEAQHRLLLDGVIEQSPTHRSWIAWFMTRPMWLDLGGLRIVHACWAAEAIEGLRRSGLHGHDDTLTDDARA
jgi:hypothetical protein